MANNNNYNSYNNQRQPSRGFAPAAPVVAKAIPENYVDLAETLMSANSKKHHNIQAAQLVQHCQRYL